MGDLICFLCQNPFNFSACKVCTGPLMVPALICSSLFQSKVNVLSTQACCAPGGLASEPGLLGLTVQEFNLGTLLFVDVVVCKFSFRSAQEQVHSIAYHLDKTTEYPL